MPSVVGWIEYVDFSEWNIRSLKANADTGARGYSNVLRSLRMLGKRQQALLHKKVQKQLTTNIVLSEPAE